MSSTTAGYAVDSGTALSSGVTLGTLIAGRILATGTLATVQLFGPGVFRSGVSASAPLMYGSGTFSITPASGTASGYVLSSDWTNFETAFNNYLYPVKNGFTQQPTSSYSPVIDAYTYKVSISPSLYTPSVSNSSYGAWWIDRGGFGAPSNGISTVAPYDYELLRLSAVTQASVRENTLEVFDFTTQGLGSVPGSFFNEAGVDSYGSSPPPLITMYGINTHTSGCAGTKCGQTMPSYQDHDIRQIGIESDVEERSGYSSGSHTMKMSLPSLGVYSVCVDCNNSGNGVVGTSSFAPNIAFLAGANTAMGASGSSPWGVAFESGQGGAITGIFLNPAKMATPSDGQPIQQCALPSSGPPLLCTMLQTSALSVFSVTSPGVTQIVNSMGVQSTHYGPLSTAVVPSATATSAITSTPVISGSDSQGTVTIPSTTVTLTGSTTTAIVQIAFGTPYQNPPNCLVSQNLGTTSLMIGHSNPAVSGFSITASVANSAAKGYGIDYMCSGN